MDADQAVCQEFFGLEEMADIGPRIIAARIALAAFFDGMEIVGILGVAHGQAARMGHGHAVAGNARREDAVEHIDAAGVGTPDCLLEGVARGVDFFDCVMPARNARHAKLFTWSGTMNLKNAKYERDERPIDAQCDCPVCRRYSRAYLRHLFKAEEMLAMRLAVMHNLYFYNKLTERIRQALDAGRFAQFRSEYSERLAQRAED